GGGRRTAVWWALSLSIARRLVRSRTGIRSWFAISRIRPSSPSRTRGCSMSCESRCNSRPQPPTCSRLSAARRSICGQCSIHSSNPRHGCAVPNGPRFGWQGMAFTRLLRGLACRASTRSAWIIKLSLPDQSLVGVALESKSVQLADAMADVDEEVARRSRLGNIRTMLGVPLLREGASIGVLLLQKGIVEPFMDKQIELAETFADQAVIAIENVRLFDEVQARTRELSESLEQRTATAAVLRIISSSPTDAQPVFDTIAKSVARLCKAQFCHVFRFDGELIHFAAVHGYAPEVAGTAQSAYPMAPGRGTAAARSILSGAVEQIPDFLPDRHYPHRHFAKVMNYRSIVAVPMLKDGRAIGAIAIARSQTGHFPEWQIKLLRTFADHAVIAIENVRLFDEVQARTRELSESLQQQTATSEVLQVISTSSGELEPVFETILANAVRICEATFGNMYL